MVDGDGKPVSFLDVHVPAHLAFYRAGIAAITDEDPYAGLLVSMHGAGIYRQRYGSDTSLGLTRAPEAQALRHVEQLGAARIPAGAAAQGTLHQGLESVGRQHACRTAIGGVEVDRSTFQDVAQQATQRGRAGFGGDHGGGDYRTPPTGSVRVGR